VTHAINTIRNIAIIAHIDHGKSTLADRLIQCCGGLSEREMANQVLDSMDIERERGITIKAQSVTLNYTASDGKTYQMNFIDTPGHVDFSYEVSRSLAACEGALLVVDAAQGVEAQTVAVCYMATEQGLDILPVLNKIDLPQADPQRVCQEIEHIIGVDTEQAVQVSAKAGTGIHDLLEGLIHFIPPPQGEQEEPLKALIIDSWFDSYLGVVSLVRVMQGRLKQGEKIRVLSTGQDHIVDQLGFFTPKRHPVDRLDTGQVGYVIAGIKAIHGAPVGDTLTQAKRGSSDPLPGFADSNPQVFAGLFPVNTDDYQAFREALDKLSLNDASLSYEPENSKALGFGFRCGFLGMLHMEIVRERLEREYDLDLITTAPTVVYEVISKKGECLKIDNPVDLPPTNEIDEIREPIATATILVPSDHLGGVIQICIERRGVQKNIQYTANQVTLTYDLPMSEIVLDFFDRLKSASRGYASLDYHFSHFQKADVVKLDMLINSEKVDALATIIHKDRAYKHGRQLAERLKTLIPRQMFAVSIQAAIGAKIIARETVSAIRKNVTAKCYGGDITRKQKLLKKQKAGKKRLKQIGQVVIPTSAFLDVLKVDND